MDGESTFAWPTDGEFHRGYVDTHALLKSAPKYTERNGFRIVINIIHAINKAVLNILKTLL